ncbi:FHA domain-containing protein [bacterium]|nr:FHA domain-containing protein [bacterium]
MAILQRRDSGDEIALSDGVTRIGRRSANEIHVNHKFVSRHHCHIERSGGGWRVVDAGSKVGTLVNGRRVQERQLKPGDEIKVGPVVFVFQDAGPARAEGELPEVRALSDSAAVRVLPKSEPAADGEEEAVPQDDPSPPRRRRLMPVVVGAAVALLGVGLLGALLLSTRSTPEHTVKRAADLLRRRDGAALWRLVSAERKIEMTGEEFREQVDAVDNATVMALETLDVGRSRRGSRGMLVPVSVTVGGKRLDDEVVLYREDGAWRIYAVPVERASELKP